MAARNQLGSTKIAKLTTLVRYHYNAKPDRHIEEMSRASKLWTAEDFDMTELEKFGVDVPISPITTKPKHVSRAWWETLEMPENEKGEKIDHIPTKRLLRKYDGLLWRALDENGRPL